VGQDWNARDALVGRDHERRAMRDVLASVRAGMSGALVVRGEAGIGKTALLDDIVAGADEFEVLRIVGIESEMSFGFAALHQLLRPLLDQVGSLPAGQGDALRAAFGMGGEAPETFRVALATLTLLAARAATRGLVIVVDDAQWLDFESERVLGLVARRLHADRIALFVALREPIEHEFAIQSLESIRLVGLAPTDALELMASVVDSPVEAVARDRIIADARGNPLAVVEMTKELVERAAPGTALQPQPVRLDNHLQELFLRQVDALAPATKRLLLAASADPTGDAALLWRAGLALEFDEGAAEEAEAADLITFGPPISFRHPLIRGAIYHGASDSERRRVHAALAEAIGPESPDRAAWHRAAATLAPNEPVATELEAAAARAAAQGAFFASGTMLHRSAELTPDTARRGVRLVQAAAADFTAGQHARAHTALDEAKALIRDPFLRAQARRLEGAIDFMLGTDAHAPAMLLQSAYEMYEADARLARETVMDALRMSVWFGKYATAGPRDVALAAKKLPLPPGEPATATDRCLDALAEYFLAGMREAAPRLRAALTEFQTDPLVRRDPRRFWPGIWTAFALSDQNAMRMLVDEYIGLSRSGALVHLAEALNYGGITELLFGTVPRAAAYFAEEHQVQLWRDALGEFNELLVHVWSGRDSDVRASASSLAATAREQRIGLATSRIDWCIAILDLAVGNYEAASAALTAASDWTNDIAMSAVVAADAVEAHARAGAPERTAEFIAFLDDRATATHAPLDLGLRARSRALVSNDDEAEPQYEDAIAHLSQGAGLLHVARARLVYGEWLRRQKRRRDARDQLRAAYDAFVAMTARGFAERAAKELVASGETARKRVDETRYDLTPQETQVALLAAAGATNADIASQLFVSSNTVDFHLRKVYRKLEISSRRELPALVDRLG
jgi:DNA-binding CsgD family transcriptional regulator